MDSKVTNKELKKAYYGIVFDYHPDRKSEVVDKERANQQMMVINGSYFTYIYCVVIVLVAVVRLVLLGLEVVIIVAITLVV